MDDKMCRVKEVMEISGYSQSKSYNMIKKLKEKYKLKYPEAFISERLLREYLGMNKV